MPLKEVEACPRYDTALLEMLAPGIPISVDGTPEVEEECVTRDGLTFVPFFECVALRCCS